MNFVEPATDTWLGASQMLVPICAILLIVFTLGGIGGLVGIIASNKPKVSARIAITSGIGIASTFVATLIFVVINNTNTDDGLDAASQLQTQAAEVYDFTLTHDQADQMLYALILDEDIMLNRLINGYEADQGVVRSVIVPVESDTDTTLQIQLVWTGTEWILVEAEDPYEGELAPPAAMEGDR